MAACIPVSEERIRAEVYLGNVLIARTPFVKSFNVSKSRSQVSNTFNVTLEIIAGSAFPLGQNLSIRAGTRGNLKTIFTGIIEGTQAQPAFGKPSYFSLTLSGRGVLSNLENKKFSRRLKSDGQGLFCTINSGSANRPQAYTSLDKSSAFGNQIVRSNYPNPARTGHGENSPFIKAPDVFSASQGVGGLPSQVAGKPTGGDGPGQTTGTGLTVHDHSTLETGGPAFGVYSAD